MTRRGWISLCLLLVTAAVFARTAENEFLWWDDSATLHQNPDMNPPTVAGVLRYWAHPHQDLYVPVTYTVWGGLAAVGRLERPDAYGIGLSSAVFHIASILVHCASAILVFWILLGLVGSDWGAAAGALLFAVHPLQAEAVAWASGLKDLLAGMFSMLAIWQYLIAFHEDAGMLARPSNESWPARTLRPRLHYTVATAALMLALLSKPSAMVVPLLVLIIDRLLLATPWMVVFRRLWPWLILSGACAVVTRMVQTTIVTVDSPLWARPLIAADALAFYLWKLILPVGLGVDYGRSPAAVMGASQAYYTWLAPAAIAGLLVYYRRQARPLAAAGLLAVGGVLPVLGLVRFEFQEVSTVADHYLYLSMLGPALAVAWLVGRYANLGTTLIAGVAAIALAGLTVIQGSYWQDDAALWRRGLEVNPRSWTAAANLGAFLKHLGGQPDLAADYLRRAIALKSDYAAARDSLGNYLLQRGRYDQAIEQFREVLRLSRPGGLDPVPTMNDLGVALMQTGRYQEAADVLRDALKRQPDHVDARANLRKVMDLVGRATSRPVG